MLLLLLAGMQPGPLHGWLSAKKPASAVHRSSGRPADRSARRAGGVSRPASRSSRPGKLRLLGQFLRPAPQFGGPFDLFLSADADYPRKLIEEGLRLREEDLFLYAIGGLVRWRRISRPTQPLNVEREGLLVLLDPSVVRIAIANPRSAPYGRAAEAALKSMNLYDQVNERAWCLGDNIAPDGAVPVESQAADVGILSRSPDRTAPNLQKGAETQSVPPEAYPRLEQAGVIMKGAQDRRWRWPCAISSGGTRDGRS